MKIIDAMAREVESVDSDAALDEAAFLMRGAGVASLPVVEHERLVGVLSARDIIERAVAEGLDPVATKVRDVMSELVVSCGQEGDVEDATALMERHQVRSVFIVDESGALAGVIALEDVDAYAGRAA